MRAEQFPKTDPPLPVTTKPQPSRELARSDTESNWLRLPSLHADRIALRQLHLYGDSIPGSPSDAFDLLRTELLQATASHGLTRIAVTAARRGTGTTHVAANLALSVARRPSARVALADLDLGAPGLASRFTLKAPGPLGPILAGEAPIVPHLRLAARNLALLLNGQRCRAPASILGEESAHRALDDLEQFLQPDLLLIDLPPLLEGDAALSILSAMDGVLLVADGTATRPDDIRDCERVLDGRSRFVGMVLNRAEDATRRWRRAGKR